MKEMAAIWCRYSQRKYVSLAVAVALTISSWLLPASAATDEPSADRLARAIEHLDQLARENVDKGIVQGLAIGVVHNDALIFSKGYGVREAGKQEKIDADTVFELASVSKPIAATVVASLIGEGRISWDSKISDLDPEFQMYDPWVTKQLTLRDMFAHRSGLPEHAGDSLEDLGFDRQQVLHRLRYQRPDSSFRSAYAYTNFGLTEAAVAAAKALNMTWEQAAEERLFKPLGMTSTSARYSDYAARDNRAALHVLADGKWTAKNKRDADAQSPAGGISSSVNDMAKWLRLRLANGKWEGTQLVKEAPLTETQHPHMLTGFNPLNGLPGFYGLGINVNYDEQGRLKLGHSGAFAMGESTLISMVPSEKLGLVILSNSRPVGVPEGLSAVFMDDALNGKQTQDWIALFKRIFADPATLGLKKGFDFRKPPAVKRAALDSSAYTGSFTNSLYGKAAIEQSNGALTLVIGPHELRLPMQHYSGDTFTYETIGENAVGLSGITFLIGPDGKATQLTIENLNEFGQGAFSR